VWPDVEPQEGQWDWANLDREVALAEQHRVEILLPIALSPGWASARPDESSPYGPGNAAEPRNAADWQNYVRGVATRYKGRVHEFEIWNEPNLKQFFTGTPQQLVSLTCAAHQTLRDFDSTNIVVSPAPTGIYGLAWLEKFLQAGGGDCVDVIGYHLYVTPKPPEAMLDLITRIQTLMEKYGISNKPLWNTETGWLIQGEKTEVKPGAGPWATVLSEEEASAYIARAYTMAWAAGVARFYWYDWDGRDMGLIEPDGVTLKTAAKAYQEVEDWLIGAQMDACEPNSASTWTCHISRSGSYNGWIVWNPLREFDFDIPATWDARSARDLKGGRQTLRGVKRIRIGPTPILLETPAA